MGRSHFITTVPRNHEMFHFVFNPFIIERLEFIEHFAQFRNRKIGLKTNAASYCLKKEGQRMAKLIEVEKKMQNNSTLLRSGSEWPFDQAELLMHSRYARKL